MGANPYIHEIESHKAWVAIRHYAYQPARPLGAIHKWRRNIEQPTVT